MGERCVVCRDPRHRDTDCDRCPGGCPDPTPAPTAPLTDGSNELHARLHGSSCVEGRYVGCKLPDELAAIERDAIARHREQADAEVARLREVLSRIQRRAVRWAPREPEYMKCVDISRWAQDAIAYHPDDDATRPHAPSLPAGAPGYEEIEG